MPEFVKPGSSTVPEEPGPYYDGKPLRTVAKQFEDALCPLPGCHQPLYIVYTMSQPVLLSDTAAELGPGDWTQTWYVECENSHRILLPPDTAEDSYTFGRCRCEPDEPEDGCAHSDMARLRQVLDLGHVSP